MALALNGGMVNLIGQQAIDNLDIDLLICAPCAVEWLARLDHYSPATGTANAASGNQGANPIIPTTNGFAGFIPHAANIPITI